MDDVPELGREVAEARGVARYQVLGLAGAVFREQAAEQISLTAAGAAFWLVISAFPTAIAAVNLFGLVVAPERVATDLGALARAAPSSVGSLVTDQLRRAAASDHTGLSVGLAISVALAVWSASAGVYNLDRAVRDAYGLARQSYVDARGRAFAGAFAVVIAIGLIALVTSVVVANSPSLLLLVVGVPALFAVVAAAIATFFRFSLGRTASWRSLLPGAIASSIGLGLLIVGFGVYVSVSPHYRAVYGASAGAVIGMVATYLGVYVVLLGAVLNLQLAGGRTVAVPQRDAP